VTGHPWTQTTNWQDILGLVFPIYNGKGKDKTDPVSDRPVSLIPAVSKLFEKVILNRVNRFLHTDEVNFPNSQQQGFQSNLSCLTTSFALQKTVLYHIERKSDVYVASLDQKAALDTISSETTCAQLRAYSTDESFWRTSCVNTARWCLKKNLCTLLVNA